MESRLEERVRHVAPALELLKIAKRVNGGAGKGDNTPQRVDHLYLLIETREYEGEHNAIFQVRADPIILIKNDGYHRSKSFAERNDGWPNSFQLTVDKHSREVRFGPSGNIMIWPAECRGLGIASYAFGKLIRWAQEKYPDYKVLPVKVEAVDAAPDNKERRNHFYEKHGLTGKFRDPGEKSGVFTCAGVMALIPHEPSTGVEVLDVKKFACNLLKDAQESKHEAARLQSWAEREQQRAEELVRKSGVKNRFIIALIILVACLCWILYHLRQGLF